MAIRIMDGSTGKAHVTSDDWTTFNTALYGSGNAVLRHGSGFELTMSTPNRGTLGTGACIVDGKRVWIDAPEAVTVESGTQGRKRHDIVGIRYERYREGGFDRERAVVEVIKGTPAEGAAADPKLPERFIALWRVPLDGINAGTPVRMYEEAASIAGLADSAPKALTRDIKMYMESGTTERLSEPVSAQRHGVVLVWSWHDGSETKSWNWVYSFVPKWHVSGNPGTSGVVCSGICSDGVMAKYVYLTDNQVTGSDTNYQNFNVGGLTVANRSYVLRWVLGV